MEKIALLPGGFKPPHAGHYNMAKWLAANTDADSIVIRVGSKERNGITREMSLKLWDLYRDSDSDSPPLAILASENNSPVADVYDFIEQEAPEGSKVYLGAGEKDKEDSRYNNIGKFADPKNIDFEIVLVPPQAGGVSGTEMRGFINDGDENNFKKYLPEHLTPEQKEEAWKIVTTKPEVEEDFYDPKNKTVDFMRSSEYKAGMPDGSKEDINPSYKYHRAGVYGRMYEQNINPNIDQGFEYQDDDPPKDIDDLNQIEGCMDENATNYNSLATIEDGSCEFEGSVRIHCGWRCNVVDGTNTIQDQGWEYVGGVDNSYLPIAMGAVGNPTGTIYDLVLYTEAQEWYSSQGGEGDLPPADWYWIPPNGSTEWCNMVPPYDNVDNENFYYPPTIFTEDRNACPDYCVGQLQDFIDSLYPGGQVEVWEFCTKCGTESFNPMPEQCNCCEDGYFSVNNPPRDVPDVDDNDDETYEGCGEYGLSQGYLGTAGCPSTGDYSYGNMGAAEVFLYALNVMEEWYGSNYETVYDLCNACAEGINGGNEPGGYGYYSAQFSWINVFDPPIFNVCCCCDEYSNLVYSTGDAMPPPLSKTVKPSKKFPRPEIIRTIKKKFKQKLKENQGGKTLRVYDFDDTLAVTKGANIKVKHKDGSIDSLDPAEFAVYKEQPGDKFDFTEFDSVIKEATPIQHIVDMLKKDVTDASVDKVTILTARLLAYPVKRYIREDLGLDVYVVAVGSSDPLDKATWIEDHILKGYNDIMFIDDSEPNRKAVKALKDIHSDIKLDVYHPNELSEAMYGMMTRSEKRKHKKTIKKIKRGLKKYQKKNKYFEVPKSWRGSLTRKYKRKRKLYNEQLVPDNPSPYDNVGATYTTSNVDINNNNIPVEVMRTPEEQTIGMMGREELKGGMMFAYDQASKKDFHMEDCLIPLDIVFINKGVIDNIHSSCPPCKETPCPKYSGMADNVLELPGGYCKQNNINVGDEVKINLTERKLTKKEKKDKEKIVKGLKGRKDLDKSDMYAIATAQAKKMEEGDTYEKMAAKGKKKGNLKQGTVRKRLKIKAGDKIPLSKINKAISRIKKMKNPSEKNKKYLKALNLAKTLKTTTHKENIDPKAQAKHKGKSAPYGSAYEPVNEADPKKGTGKKPKGSGRRLYTDENPKDTVKVKFSTRQDIVDTLTKKSFKSKPHKRQSQIINLIHQRVRAALSRTKDPEKKKRLKSAFEYIKKRKESSKKKTQRMKKENVFTKGWWKDTLNEMLLKEGGAAGHMAHPFNLPDVNSGSDLKDIFNKSAESLQNNPGSVKIDGVNSSIRLIDLDGEKQFVMDRGSKKELDVKGITKDDLLNRFGDGHGMVKIGGEVLDMFNEALPSIKNDLEKLGAYNDPNILFNMEYVSGKTNVQDYGSNFIAIHGLNKIETKEVQGKRKMLTKRISSEVSYDKSALQSLLDNLAPIAKEKGFEVYGSVPTEMTKKPNFSAALSKSYTIVSNEEEKTQTLDAWLNELNNIPEEDFIFMNVEGSKKKVGAVSKQVYTTLLNGGNIDELFETEDDKNKAIEGFTTYLATEKLGDEVLKVLDSPMGSVENHEGVVIRDENLSKVPFKITGKFILGGMASDF